MNISTLSHRTGKLVMLAAATRHFRQNPPLLIVGSPRSGTTLLLRLLTALEGVTTKFEPYQTWARTLGPAEDHSYSQVHSHVDIWRLRLAFYRMVKPESPVLLFKDPRDSIRLQLLMRTFPHAKFVHILRDPRDTIASMIKTITSGKYGGEANTAWAHVHIPGYRFLLDSPPHLQAAYQWQWCVACIIRDLSPLGHQQFITIRYEDLVNNPKAAVETIASFARMGLNQQTLASMLAEVRNTVDKNGPVSDAATLTQKGKDDPSAGFSGDAGSGTTSTRYRIGKWREELSTSVLAECDEVIGPTRKVLGYGD